jgi:hypothetical protein
MAAENGSSEGQTIVGWMALELSLIWEWRWNLTICLRIDHLMELPSLVDIVKLDGESQLISFSRRSIVRRPLI